MKRFWCFLLTLCMLSTVALAEETDWKAYWSEKIDTLIASMKDYYVGTEEEAKIAPYDEPITVSYVNYYDSLTQNAMGIFTEKYGETWDNTRWTEAARRLYNIDLQPKWWVIQDQYDQKLRLDLAANDLPDVFLVQKQEDLQTLVESELIWDLTDLYDQYAVEMDKANWESDGGYLLKMATFDDRLYALPAGLSDTDLFSYIWIRDDWLKKLELDYPKTLEELKAVMDAFMAADFDGNGIADTIGMGIDKDLYYTTRGIFSAYGGYPEFWTEQDGSLVWGGVTENTKNALGYLADLYASGYLDREFITQSNTDMLEAAIAGNCGVVYGGHWLGMNWGDAHELNPECEWVCIDLPRVNVDDEPVRQCLQPYGHGWVVVSKECENPEVLFKLFAMADFSWYGADSGWWIYDENAAWMHSPVHVCCSAWENVNAYRQIQEVYKTGDASQLHFNGLAYWEKLNGDVAYEWSLMFGNSAEREGIAMEVCSTALDNGQLFYEPFYGTMSTFMQDHWSTIKDEQLILFTKIILGETDLEEGFAGWKNTFDNLGGKQITEEVNAWYAAQQ